MQIYLSNSGQEPIYAQITRQIKQQILSGALDVDVECCEQCKKLEFYLLGDADTPETSGIQQIACPYCGDMHDMDDAICPHCGRRLMEL